MTPKKILLIFFFFKMLQMNPILSWLLTTLFDLVTVEIYIPFVVSSSFKEECHAVGAKGSREAY